MRHDDFVCKRCGHANTHPDRFVPRWSRLAKLCDRCFADRDTGTRGFYELFVLAQFFMLRLVVGAGVAGIPLAIAWVVCVPGGLDHPPAVRGAILLVPAVVLALVLWRRRVGK
jgi:hypothetical protein